MEVTRLSPVLAIFHTQSSCVDMHSIGHIIAVGPRLTPSKFKMPPTPTPNDPKEVVTMTPQSSGKTRYHRRVLSADFHNGTPNKTLQLLNVSVPSIHFEEENKKESYYTSKVKVERIWCPVY